jgi:serine/threonine-protein kinase
MNQAATFGSTRPIIPAGTQLNGIYEIDEPIAAGGMGEIYKGHAIQTGDLVAIKLIRSDLAEAEAAFALFRKEASALHNLYHEAIVRYYVFTIDPVLERPYLAMEFVDGLSLSAMLRGGPLAFEAVHRLMQRIASGLQAAHERGIIHRDVSPDNIIIPQGDMARAKIIDFGIARSTRLDDEGTVIGSGFAGKYNYVSPEQLGLFGGEVTPKSDIYSLGLVLAEALRNGPIDMGGNHVDVIEKRRVVPDVGPIDPRLRPLIERMLQPNPVDRPQSMAEVVAWNVDAAPALGSRRPTRTRQISTAKPARPGIAIGRTPAILIGAAFLALAAAAPGLYIYLQPAPSAVPPPPDLQAEASPALTDERKPRQQASNLAQESDLTKDSPPVREPAPVKPGLAPMNLAKLDLDQPSRPDAEERAETDPVKRGVIDAIASSIKQYDGGDCFFAKPISITEGAATIEGFGASTVAFRGLDEAFRRANGFEADIGVRPVNPGQCPAIAFLGRLRNDDARPLKLDLAAASLKVGQSLAGAVSGLDGRQAEVLVVTDDGLVRTLPLTRIGAHDDAASFALRTGAELGNGKIQLVLAVASRKTLASLRGGQPTQASKVFPQALAEAERTNQSLAAAARSFKVEK